MKKKEMKKKETKKKERKKKRIIKKKINFWKKEKQRVQSQYLYLEPFNKESSASVMGAYSWGTLKNIVLFKSNKTLFLLKNILNFLNRCVYSKKGDPKKKRSKKKIKKLRILFVAKTKMFGTEPNPLINCAKACKQKYLETDYLSGLLSNFHALRRTNKKNALIKKPQLLIIYDLASNYELFYEAVVLKIPVIAFTEGNLFLNGVNYFLPNINTLAFCKFVCKMLLAVIRFQSKMIRKRKPARVRRPKYILY